MSDWTLVQYNAQSGVSTWIMIEGDKTYVQERQDVSKLLDENVALQNIASDGWKGDYHSVARIPAAMAYDPQSPVGAALKANDDDYLRKFLNDSENSKLRTKRGNL